MGYLLLHILDTYKEGEQKIPFLKWINFTWGVGDFGRGLLKVAVKNHQGNTTPSFSVYLQSIPTKQMNADLTKMPKFYSKRESHRIVK